MRTIRSPSTVWVRRTCGRLGLPYAPAEQGWRVTVPDPAAAAELIRREPALFRDFELTKGRMDDVSLAVTGKKLAGGAEK